MRRPLKEKNLKRFYAFIRDWMKAGVFVGLLIFWEDIKNISSKWIQ